LEHESQGIINAIPMREIVMKKEFGVLYIGEEFLAFALNCIEFLVVCPKRLAER